MSVKPTDELIPIPKPERLSTVPGRHHRRRVSRENMPQGLTFGTMPREVGQERLPIQALEHPAIGAILLLARVGLSSCEEASLPLQKEQLRIRTGPDRRVRSIGV